MNANGQKKKGVSEMLVQTHMVVPVVIYCFVFYPIIPITAMGTVPQGMTGGQII